MRKSKYNTELAEYGKRVITEYINNCKAQNKRFANKTQLINEMMPEFVDKSVSTSSVRRYLNELKFFFDSPSSYGFKEYSHKFNELISYLGMKNHICFYLNEPSLGDIIAEKINEYYCEESVYCVAVKELLICFYVRSKNSKINDIRLKKEIPEILSRFIFEEMKSEK